jgi:hypothetical protein
VLLINEKHVKQYYIPNVTGMIITSNYAADCIFLPPDDRRHYVAASERLAGSSPTQHAKNFGIGTARAAWRMLLPACGPMT